MSQTKTQEQLAEEIIKTESENTATFLREELDQELAMANAHSVSPIRVIVIGGNEQYYKTVLIQLRQKYPEVEFVKFVPAGGSNAFFAIDSLDPDIMLVAHDAPVQNAVQFHDAIQTQKDFHGNAYAEKYADKRIIVMTPNDYQYAVELRRHGIQFMLPMVDPRFHSVDPDVLIKVIHEAYTDIQQAKHNRELHIEAPQPEMTGFSGFTPNAPSYRAPRQQQNANYGYGYGNMEEAQPVAPHKVIGVYSGSGGAGKTTFATNIASILAKYTQDDGADYRVCLVEYNLTCRNIDLFLNVKFPPRSKKSLASIAQEAHAMYFDKNEGNISAGPREMIPLISKYVEHIPSTGLDIIPGIAVPLEIDNISPGFSTALFTALRQMYDVVIVDLCTDIAKLPMLETLNEIDDFYYVMPTDVTGIFNARILIKFLSGSYRKAPEEIKVIMNKLDPENEAFGVDQITSTLIEKGKENCTPEGTIPYFEKDITQSINEGNPIAIAHPEHPVSQALFSIALGINPMLNMGILEQEQEEKEAKENKKGFFAKLFGGGKKKNKEDKKDDKQEGKAIFNKKKSEEEATATPAVAIVKEDEKPKKKGLFGRK